MIKRILTAFAVLAATLTVSAAEYDGKWIGCDYEGDILKGNTVLPARYLRKEVTLDGKVKEATLRISGLVLPVMDVSQPLGIEGVVVEYVGFAVATHRAVTKPAKPLVPLRAVGRHTAIIAPDSPESVVVDLVDDRVGCLEMSRDGHLVVHHLPLEIAELRFVLQAFYLNVTETVVNIFRMPDDRLAVLGDVGVEDLCGTEIGKVESAVRIEKFSELHREGVASLQSSGLDLKAADHILSHVQDVTVIGLGDGDRLHDVLNSDVRVRLENQSAARSVHQ